MGLIPCKNCGLQSAHFPQHCIKELQRQLAEATARAVKAEAVHVALQKERGRERILEDARDVLYGAYEKNEKELAAHAAAQRGMNREEAEGLCHKYASAMFGCRPWEQEEVLDALTRHALPQPKSMSREEAEKILKSQFPETTSFSSKTVLDLLCHHAAPQGMSREEAETMVEAVWLDGAGVKMSAGEIERCKERKAKLVDALCRHALPQPKSMSRKEAQYKVEEFCDAVRKNRGFAKLGDALVDALTRHALPLNGETVCGWQCSRCHSVLTGIDGVCPVCSETNDWNAVKAVIVEERT